VQAAVVSVLDPLEKFRKEQIGEAKVEFIFVAEMISHFTVN